MTNLPIQIVDNHLVCTTCQAKGIELTSFQLMEPADSSGWYFFPEKSQWPSCKCHDWPGRYDYVPVPLPQFLVDILQDIEDSDDQ